MVETSKAARKSSRRKVAITDSARWVFNRMAHVYDARPPYPEALVDTVAQLTGQVGPKLGDIGAGIGHLALPLAERGLDVAAVEPAHLMLERLRDRAFARGIPLHTVHAAAERLPFEAQSLDAILIADALHFIDTELAGREVARVLSRRGVLIVITCELARTPFMQRLAQIMESATQRRPRQIEMRSAQLFGVARVQPTELHVFQDETQVNEDELERILASISFVGPAMNPERAAAFRALVHQIDLPAMWGRKFVLQAGFAGRVQSKASLSTP